MKIKLICYTLFISSLQITPLRANNVWIDKAHQYAAVDEKSNRWNTTQSKQAENVNLYELLDALPAPEDWETLRKDYADSLPRKGTSTTEAALTQLLLAYLNGDPAAMDTHLKSLDEKLGNNERYRYIFNELKREVYATNAADNVEKIIENFERELEEYAPKPSPPKGLADIIFSKMFSLENQYLPSVEVPDFVTLVGETRARELLEKALKTRVQLYFNQADSTRRLAAQLALESHESLAVPQWSLVSSINQTELYKRMAAKFPTSSPDDFDYELKQAKGYYFWGLVAQGRAEDAVAFIETHPEFVEYMPYDAISQLKRAGYGKPAWAFLDRLLRKQPHLDLWEDYLQLSAEYGKSAQMLETVKQSIAANDKATETQKVKQHKLLASAYLGANEVEAGVEWLQKTLALEVSDPVALRKQLDAALNLAEIGHLLENSGWLEAGLVAIRLEKIGLSLEHGYIENEDAYLQSIQLYQKLGMYAEALNLVDGLIARLETIGEQAVAKGTTQQGPFGFHKESYRDIQDFRHQKKETYQKALVAKTGLLVAEGNYTAAKALLDKSVLWNAADAADLLSTTDTSPQENPFGWLVAKILHQQGDNEHTANILEALLVKNNGFDPAYALYTEICVKKAISFLDTLYKLDKFQERPLIWKAQLLLNSGDIEAAEILAKQAIEIDPSDGEQPKNDRMRVYDVMRQVKSAQGNTDEAAFFADVLKAIRLSENADDYYSVGLYTEAIERYLRSLEFFQDAYCIQSRVAVRLYNQSHVEEALKHYRKAYELMPSSFGLVESHCFGCESVFDGEEPQSIADEVFSGLLETQPETPQVHYLIGYLRNYQERRTEALKHFKDAVSLNPDYLNAWKKMAELSEEMSFSNKENDAVILKIYKLDPLGQHSSPNLSEVNNLKAMWQAVLHNQKTLQIVPKRKELYPLKGSAEHAVPSQDDWDFFNYRQVIKRPVDALKDNAVVNSIEDLFVALSQ